MLRRTKISWADYSGADLGFVIGCTPISEGCANCYAAGWAKRSGRDFSDVRVYWEKLSRLWKATWEPGDTPYRRGPGSKPIMFPVDLGDLFHPDVPEIMILVALNVFAARADADWVLLTKRPRRMLDTINLWLRIHGRGQLYNNIWCLVTAENQRRADERIPILLQVKAQVRGVSIEPMLGPVDLRCIQALPNKTIDALAGSARFEGSPIVGFLPHDITPLNWVILGAESGPDRRHFERANAVDVYQQCRNAGVPFFGKQDSGLRPGVPLLIGGKEIKEFPHVD